MSYRIVKHKENGFHVMWDRWEGRRVARYVPQQEWPSLGFRKGMKFEEARARAKQLTILAQDKKWEAKRNAINEKLRNEERRLNVSLPETFLSQFETEYLVRKYGGSHELKRAQIIWRATKRIITEFNVPPEEWADTPEMFFRKFKEKAISFDYSRRILKMLNLWGYFLCRKLGKPFLPIPPIPRKFREEIHERFHEEGEGKTSRPLTADHLRKAKHNLERNHYNWLFISLWLGLRPKEVDRLHEEKYWKTNQEDGYMTIHVYQRKLTSVPMDRRWKVIPILCPEQAEAIRIIKSGRFNRPLVKTLERKIDDKIYTYAGRKGFVRLMRSKGRSTYETSAWMGHHSIDRTRQDYEEPAKLIIENGPKSFADGMR